MPLDPQQTLYLADSHGRRLGRVAIDRIEGNRLFGRFTPEEGFAAACDLFDEFEAAVNEQLFSEADRLSQEIDRLGLNLRNTDAAEELAVCDVQIMDVGSCATLR